MAPQVAQLPSPKNSLSRIPSVDALLKNDTLRDAIARHGRQLVVDSLREVLAALRASRAAGPAAPLPDEPAIVALTLEQIGQAAGSTLRRVFNLTGTVLHTNLGRAPLPREAILAVAEAMEYPCTLEYDLEQGGRGERDDHIEALICRLTGAEAATVVNNNAAAVLLTLNSLALAREVVVSRGELVEIGGAFRIPDVMVRAGCGLREVGTTNRTHPDDYAAAIGESTAALMKVHTSNYTVVGFTRSVSEQELSPVARAHGIPLITDLGSGSLIDMAAYGLPHEPTPRDALAQGADVVTFSGDKLLGGPQCGIIAGRKDLVAKIRRNPLKRALRLDKMSIAALHAVLSLYLDPETLRMRLPALRLLTRPVNEIEACAARMLGPLTEFFEGKASVDIVSCQSQIGSGSLPVDLLPSSAIRLTPLGEGRDPAQPSLAAKTNMTIAGECVSAGRLAELLRTLAIPVIGRLHENAVWLDLRCLEDEAGFLSLLGVAAAPEKAP